MEFVLFWGFLLYSWVFALCCICKIWGSSVEFVATCIQKQRKGCIHVHWHTQWLETASDLMIYNRDKIKQLRWPISDHSQGNASAFEKENKSKCGSAPKDKDRIRGKTSYTKKEKWTFVFSFAQFFLNRHQICEAGGLDIFQQASL